MSNPFLAEALRVIDETKKQAAYKSDPVLWAKEVIGFHMWSKQREVAQALLENKKVAVSSCHGSGKSALTAVLILWWVCTRLSDDAIAMVSAPTYNQLHAIIFESLRKIHREYGLPGTINQQDEWKSDAGTILAFGRKPSDQNESAFQGIHRTGGVFVCLDEAVGVHENIFVGAEAVTTGNLDKILAIFNPDDINSYIGRAWKRKDPSWHFIKISAFETPNFTGEWVPDIARNGLVSPAWVEEKKLSWGEDSPRYKSKILGEFSEGSTNSLFTLETINRGIMADITPTHENAPVLGFDIARFGEDYSVGYINEGGRLRMLDSWSKATIPETSRKIHQLALDTGAKEVRIDGVGIGAGVVDQVTELAEGRYVVISLVGNAQSPDLQRWANARAYWYDTVRDDMFNSKVDIADSDLAVQDELIDVQYNFTNRGGVQLESKDEIRKRLGKSPDYADAFIYAAVDLEMDPDDPLSALSPGDEFEMDYDELFGEVFTIGPGGGW